MRGLVKKWGNSAAVRLPAALLEAAQVSLDQKVVLRVEQGRIIIEPVRPSDIDLETLLAGMTDDNRHDPVEMGPQVGHEVW